MIKFFRNLSFPSFSFSRSEKRSGTTTLKNPLSWLFGGTSKTGITVNRTNILGDSAVWAALRILSNGVASLPWQVFREEGDIRQRDTDHPVDYLINKEPHPLYTSFSFRQSLIFQTWLKGDGYVRIIRDPQSAAPIRLDLLQSERVELHETNTGEYYYMVEGEGINGTGPRLTPIRLEDMIHIKVMSANGITGMDLIRVHRENLGVSLAATQYGASFFGNGAHISGVLESDMEFSAEGAARLAAQFAAKYGGIDNAGSVPVLEQGVKFKPTGTSPRDAMMIETRKHQVEEVARIFGIPAHMMQAMDKATFNNIEVMSLDFVKNTLRPICVMLEQEFNRKLFTEREKRSGTLYTRFNLDSLMRGATKDRFDAYAIAIQNKIMNRNEVRALENLNPVDGGEKFENPMIQVEPNEPQINEQAE